MSKQIIKNFGIIVDKLGTSQHSYMLVSNINLLLEKEYIYSPIIFYKQPVQTPIIPRCTQLQQYHAWGFEGILLSTNINTTLILQQCLKAKRKLFYVYDLEWLYMTDFNYGELKDIYDNDEIDLIARSQSHYDILTKCWKKPIGILNDYNYKEIIKLASSL